ncbi:MAG: UDP-N-acetylglucosamine 2-epimerase (non-hydrolyzing) [Elusimicrobia bacterium]|nr:UDP-N-acetylglucosamine 2-epimerase (non-hydrolyzing) [Elusimicrobiota bacterium]
MKKPVVLTVFGTRPEVIKLAPVLRALRESADLESRFCVTAQHRQMLDVMLSDFELRPDYDLDLMRRDQDLSGFATRALGRLQDVLRRVRPDFVLVQGDTTTAFVTALASFYEKVPVGHVEAGLRSYDRANPYPEETNRVMISRLSELHFVPTDVARRNLLAEGIPSGQIVETGNTVVDALRHDAARPRGVKEPALRSALETLAHGDKAAVVTTHRRENHGRPLLSLCSAFQTLVERHPDLHLFYPVHMNPNVSRVVRRRLRHPRVHLLPSLDYFDLLYLLRRCHFVLTDSGGLQEEGPSLGKPVVVLREVTERPEGVRAGVAVLAGTRAEWVVRAASRLMRDRAHYAAMSRGSGIFGDGRASERIVASIRHRFGFLRRRPAPFRAVMEGSK